jgi:acetolactate synthase-1/2/3 large subunit
MSKLWPAQTIVQALQDEGVEVMYGLMGGHIQPVQDYAYRAGIQVCQVRHEQAAVYAADAYARLTRRPSVCFGTAGPGMLNMVAGIHMAYVSRTPMVCLFGGHKERESHRGSMQEAYAADVCKSITKWTVRVNEPELAGHFVRKAFRDAMTPPYGPVGIEFPIDKFNWEPIEASSQIAYRPGAWRENAPPRACIEPEYARSVKEAIAAAKRPMLIGGEGIHWSGAEDTLRRFVETANIPFNLRRLGRGAVSERHPLALSAGARKDMLLEADLVIVVGLHMGYLESFGNWGTQARFIQLNATAEDILPSLPTQFELIGDPAAVLRQILDAGLRAPDDEGRRKWVQRAADAQQRFNASMSDDAGTVASDSPIHPRWLGKVVSDVITPDMTVVLDSFTASTYLSDQMHALRGGQILDAGLSAAFGHGVGMGIGAQMAAPGKPVLVMLGDGGIGLGGGDIETAVRYGQPVVYLVYNDSALCAGLENYCYGENFRVLGPNAKQGFNLTQDVRYDLMYAPLGCHTELVVDPADIGPAIARAFDSGKTAVINLVGTRHVKHPLYDSANAREMFWHLPADEVEAPARRRHHEHFFPKFHDGRPWSK